jgi:hypothetical protein
LNLGGFEVGVNLCVDATQLTRVFKVLDTLSEGAISHRYLVEIELPEG